MSDRNASHDGRGPLITLNTMPLANRGWRRRRERCPVCEGAGIIIDITWLALNTRTEITMCRGCNGHGYRLRWAPEANHQPKLFDEGDA